MASPDGSTPNPDTIVAIAAAYLVLTRGSAAPPEQAPARWRLAGRLETLDPARIRSATRISSRWSAAGRLDG